MSKRKNVFIAVFLVLVMSLLAACGGGASSGNANSANLTVWGMGAEGDSLKILANDFMKQNPGIHVTVQSIPWANAHQKLLTAVAGSQTPDVAQMGTDWMAEFAKTGALNSPAVVQALSYYQTFFKDGLSPLTEPPNFDEIQTFDQGSTPMFISGPWQIGLIKQEGGAAMNGKWAVAALPQKVSNTSFLGGSDMVVFKNSPNKAAAWKFVQYLASPAVQVKWYNTVTDLPAVQSAWNTGPLASDKNLAIFHTQLSSANGPPNIPHWDEVSTMVNNDMQQVMFGKSSPQQTAADMQQKAAAIGSGQ